MEIMKRIYSVFGIKNSSGTVINPATEDTLAALSHSEDSAHTTGDQGIQTLTVRNDTPSTLAGTDGDYQPLITDDKGKVYMSPEEYYLEAVRGNITGVSSVHKFGRNDDIDIASGFEALWNGGAEYTGFDATAAETVEVFSSDANDTSAGTGARTVEVFGLDSNYDEQNETVTLNGVTAVDTVNTYIRMPRAIVRTAGSGGVNAGTLTMRQKTTIANVFCVLPIGYNQTMICAYTIPNGKTGYLINWYGSSNKKQSASSILRLMIRPFNEIFQVKEEAAITTSGTSSFMRGYPLPNNSLNEKSDIVIKADTDTNNMGISGAFDILLIDN